MSRAAALSGWDRFEVLNRALAGTDTTCPLALRDAIANLYHVMATSFAPVLLHFKTFSEAQLNEGRAQRAQQIGRGELTVALGSPGETMLDAARLLRALEHVASEFQPHLESDWGEDLEEAWVTSDGAHYVVPRPVPLTPVEGRPFTRRGLLRYRVIPTRIAGFAVRLHRSALLSDAARIELDQAASARSYGAAFFPGLEARLDYPAKDRFTVASVDGFASEALIDSQLETAHQEDCRALAWGELTMPEASIAYLREQLGAQALMRGTGLRYLVAGSWHRRIDGVMRNVATVLDGTGEPLFEVLKWAKFEFDGRVEDIEAGEDVHVLVCEDELVAVAVCRDFLEGTSDVPYRALDVDVAIVPSMTSSIEEEATMRGHAATADIMQIRFGTRTLAVGQPATVGKHGVGQLLALPARPIVTGAQLVDCAFVACRLEIG